MNSTTDEYFYSNNDFGQLLTSDVLYLHYLHLHVVYKMLITTLYSV